MVDTESKGQAGLVAHSFTSGKRIRIVVFVPGTPQGKGRPRATLVKARNAKVGLSLKDGDYSNMSSREILDQVKKQKGKKAVRLYTPKETLHYEEIIRSEATSELLLKKVKILLNPIKIKIIANMPMPESWPKWKKKLAIRGFIAPTVKPDIDNIAKVVLDAFNGLVWQDDTQVVRIEEDKVYSTRVGVGIVVEETGQYNQNVKKPEVDETLFNEQTMHSSKSIEQFLAPGDHQYL